MFDDVRFVVDVKHKACEEFEAQPQGENRKSKRLKFLGRRDRSIRIKSIKNGTQLIFEGSLAGYVQGHNVIGTTDLTALVAKVALKILKLMKIKPSKDEVAKIIAGEIKLERADFVGYMNCTKFGGPSAVINALDTGLAGSRTKRFIAPNETLVYHVKSSYWSIMFYDKARQTKKFYPDTWKSIGSELRSFATNYVRIELRNFRKELLRQNIHTVKDVSASVMKEMFNARLQQLFADLNVDGINFPVISSRPKINELLARLYFCGVDYISRYPTETQQRIWKDIERNFHMKKNRIVPVLPATCKSLAEFKTVKHHHGIPKKLRKLKHIFNPGS